MAEGGLKPSSAWRGFARQFAEGVPTKKQARAKRMSERFSPPSATAPPSHPDRRAGHDSMLGISCRRARASQFHDRGRVGEVKNKFGYERQIKHLDAIE